MTELDATASVPGLFMYRPAIGALLAVGTQTLTATFTPSDTTAYTTVSATVSLTVLAVPPTVVNVSTSTLEGVAVAIPVLANDSDPEGTVLSIASVTQPTHGAAAISGTMVRYTPAAAFFGTDSFTYTAGDTYGGMSTATVSVLVSRLGRFVALSQDFTWLRAGTIVTASDVGAAVRRDLEHSYGRDFDDGDGDHVTVRVGVEATMQQTTSRVVGCRASDVFVRTRDVPALAREEIGVWPFGHGAVYDDGTLAALAEAGLAEESAHRARAEKPHRH